MTDNRPPGAAPAASEMSATRDRRNRLAGRLLLLAMLLLLLLYLAPLVIR